jgi:hypothetical protein
LGDDVLEKKPNPMIYNVASEREAGDGEGSVAKVPDLATKCVALIVVF